MKRFLIASLVGSLLTVGVGGQASAQRAFAKAANTEAEWSALMKQPQAKGFIVRSLKDWEALLATADSPLKGVDRPTVDAFTKELVFRGGGLAGASYGMLDGKVSKTQLNELWSKFGIGPRLLADHDGYRCASRGTCSKAAQSICTSNCRSDQ